MLILNGKGPYLLCKDTRTQGAILESLFELAASDVKGKGWIVKGFKWSEENGVKIDKAATDIKERILKKLEDKDTDGLGKDIRVYTEKAMKEIAYSIEAQVAFKYNEIK